MSFQVSKINLNLIRFIGPQGPLGSQGVAGTTGSQGSTGPDGNLGPLGPLGSQGVPGVVLGAPQGPPGCQGSLGNEGIDGVQGDQGILGDPGPPGPAGATGPDSVLPSGPPGPPGPQGAMGTQGAGGSPGMPGADGADGSQGSQGLPGAMIGAMTSTGLLYRGETGGIVETDLDPTFTLIRGRLGPNVCSSGNIEAWTMSTNLEDVDTADGEIGGQPALFTIQEPGVYFFSYNIDITDDDDDASFLSHALVECQMGPGPPVKIVGSRSSTTVDDLSVHLSHNFLYQAGIGEQIGVYISNTLQDNVCMNFNKASFLLKLIDPVEVVS